MSDPERKPPLYLIDGYNLLHAVVLAGKDRAEWHGARDRAEVLEIAARLPQGEAWVVFDGSDGAGPGPPPGSVTVSFAASADAFILERCAELCGTRQVVVVSADRSLADRALHRGADRLSPWHFAGLCRNIPSGTAVSR